MSDEAKKFIEVAKRTELNELLKLADLPKTGDKFTVKNRLLTYINAYPSQAFLSHVKLLSEMKKCAQNKRSAKKPSNDCNSVNTNAVPNAVGSTAKITDFINLPFADQKQVLLPDKLPSLVFRPSPFYKPIETLIVPTLLVPIHTHLIPNMRKVYEKTFQIFHQADVFETILYHTKHLPGSKPEFNVQIILRFAKLNPDLIVKMLEPPLDVAQRINSTVLLNIEDALPVHLNVEVNGCACTLPPLLPSNRSGRDGRRNPRPINITPQLRMGSGLTNNVRVSWLHDYESFTYYAVGFYLVQRRSISELCQALIDGASLTLEDSKKFIAAKLDQRDSSRLDFVSDDVEDDDVILPSNLTVELVCPLSKLRMSIPVRGKSCKHVKCFDAKSYLIINANKPTWLCPVCDGLAPYTELIVDSKIKEALGDPSTFNTEEIIFSYDGSWNPGAPTKDEQENSDEDDINNTSSRVELVENGMSLKRSKTSQEHSNSFKKRTSANLHEYYLNKSDQSSLFSNLPSSTQMPRNSMFNSPFRVPQPLFSSLDSSALFPRVRPIEVPSGTTIDLTIDDDDSNETSTSSSLPSVSNIETRTPPKIAISKNFNLFNDITSGNGNDWSSLFQQNYTSLPFDNISNPIDETGNTEKNCRREVLFSAKDLLKSLRIGMKNQSTSLLNEPLNIPINLQPDSNLIDLTGDDEPNQYFSKQHFRSSLSPITPPSPSTCEGINNSFVDFISKNVARIESLAEKVKS